MTDFKYLFIIHPPGAGGNHIANILSTHEDFEPRFQSTDYVNEMTSNYKNSLKNRGVPQEKDAHFSDLQNLQPDLLYQHLPQIIKFKKKYIFCCHGFEYLKGNLSKPIFNMLRNRAIILLDLPKGNNKISYSRVFSGPWINAWAATNYKDRETYTLEYFIKNNIIEQNKIFLLETDLIFTDHGFEYISNQIKENMNIDLPIIGKTLHEIYMKHKKYVYFNS